MQTILFPTDFSANAQRALEWAKLFARQYGATIVVLHVHQPPMSDATLPTIGDLGMGAMASVELEEIGRENVGKLVQQLQNEGFRAESDWRLGNVEDEIVHTANERDVDLIVTGRSELSGFFDRLIGSSATDVARSATCPVLVVPNPSDEQPLGPVKLRHILYATQLEFDESDSMRQTLAVANAFEAGIQFIKVNADNQLNLYDDKKLMAHLRQQAGGPSTSINTVDSRTVSAGLSEYLQNYPADLLVVTTRERGFWANLIDPGETEQIITRSTVPVLVLHGN
ncbi:MAG: universal stress protein [Cytophagales bacterium]|nr:MAG: universal stress protein [Cytophagales bacterium]